MSVSRRNFMLGTAAAGLVGAPAFASGSATAEYLIVVVAEGGWDVTFVFEPKSVAAIEGPEVDDETGDEDTQIFGGIEIGVNFVTRPMVSEFFANWYQKACIVNGIWMGSISHDPCRYRILTGTPDVTRPDLATIVGFTHGGALPLGSVDLSGWSITGPLAASAGRIGTNNQIKAIIDPSTHFRAPAGALYPYPLFAPDSVDRNAIQDYLGKRAERMRDVRGYDNAKNDRLFDDLVISADRGSRFRDQSVDILDALTMGSGSSMLKQTDIAVELLKAGLCKAVTIDSKEHWDTHADNSQQHDLFEALFTGLDSLMINLENAGILDKTLVLVCSEMTRSPKLNGSGGKDHWGHTSALLLGGGVNGGSQLGATDDLLESRPVDLVTGALADGGSLNKYDNFAAGILKMMDVEPDPWLPEVVPYLGAQG